MGGEAVKLHDLYSHKELWHIPFNLLRERESYQSISHKSMPTWDEHCAYVQSRPHPHWYFFHATGGYPAGCVYLSAMREVGVGVLRLHRGQGLGEAAVVELMRLHPGRFLANLNPANEPSARLFRNLGFNLIQHTYCIDR
jgi:RimJ/RimL family protein N-acetyltransferase